MRFRLLRTGTMLALVIVGGAAVAPLSARAANVLTYNFNTPNGKNYPWLPDPDPDVPGTSTPYWNWTLGPSDSYGGWQAISGTNAALSAAILTSPCLVLDNNKPQVSFEVTHRYNFPVLSGTANQLGQVQFRVDSGTGWSGWRGVPNAFFKDANNVDPPDNYKPNYGPPTQPLFGSLIDSSTTPAGTVLAWSGSTPAFDTGAHESSVLTLTYADFGLSQYDEIQFRFVMATNLATTGTNGVVWEINSVALDGVYECPEPETLALAGIGGLGCLLFVGRRRRRSRAPRRTLGSTAVALVTVAVVAGLSAPAPAVAGATWNFQTTDGGWVRTSTSPFFVPADNKWLWTGTYSGTGTITGGTSPHWRIVAQGMQPPYSSAGFLASPVFSGLSGTVPAQNARISIAHQFLYATGTSGLPINTGQVQYRLNGSGTWLGLPLSAFTSGSSVLIDDPVFGPSPFKTGTLVSQTAYLAPTYLTPSGSAALPHVSGSAAAFLGGSPSWPGNFYVPSQAFLNVTTGLSGTGISSLELRFTNLNLAGNCTQEGWNVRFVQVDFDTSIPFVPEPSAVATGAGGLATLAATAALRRRRHQRPSRPSDSP
ncbi:MAG: PEP-CTERM sorting domain-containing protein [Planctomycetaceae bacterium]